ILLWKPFVLEQGGYDENFTRRLEDLELQLRLKQQGFELRTVESAIGFQQQAVQIGDLIRREFMEGISAVFLHSKFPAFMPDIDEARRLFNLVRDQPDEQYWDRAEYHLGCIESQLGNPAAARAHFAECLRRNPRHNKARRMLNNSTLYRETEANVFEIVAPAT